MTNIRYFRNSALFSFLAGAHYLRMVCGIEIVRVVHPSLEILYILNHLTCMLSGLEKIRKLGTDLQRLMQPH